MPLRGRGRCGQFLFAGHGEERLPAEVSAALTNIAFGPVPSRRLGRSLGINNIPPKVCTYDCVYCQAGKTTRHERTRQTFYEPAEIEAAVEARLARLGADGRPDFLTFVPDGEPTLDVNLGASIARVRPFGIPVAVVSNATLIDRPDVRHDLMEADWVSIKVDTLDDDAWRAINRPAEGLSLPSILEGALQFAHAFRGTLASETMIVGGINDREDDMRAVAAYLARLEPALPYLLVPTRPPADDWVAPPSPERLRGILAAMRAELPAIECLDMPEGIDFGTTGDAEHDILAAAAVHPMREAAVARLLERSGANPATVARMVADGRLREVVYRNERFYVPNRS